MRSRYLSLGRTLLASMLVCIVATTILLVRAARAETPRSTPTYQGRSIEWWADKTTHWKKAALKRGRTLAVHRRVNRERVELGPTGVARAFLCIHRFEGSWTDPRAPFWGGLQMDMDFQRAYGGAFLDALGTADRWPPLVQIAVAMEAFYSGRGFGPWPTTRRMCGV